MLDGKGVRYLEALLAAPHREIHLLELVGADHESDAGPILDERAQRAYRARAETQRDQLGGDRGIADCVPNANDCPPQSPDRCNGVMLEFCQDGRHRDFDCSSVGLGPCGPTTNGGAG